MIDTYQKQINTPLGEMIAYATDKGVCFLEFLGQKNIEHQIETLKKQFQRNPVNESNIHLDQLEMELHEYFARKRIQFNTPLDIIGTDFQKKVWQELLRIPYGQTISYIQQATLIGNPKSVRAVANANGINKIAILIPCHRVIGTNGTLTGYAGGLNRKKYLIDLESPNRNLFEL